MFSRKFFRAAKLRRPLGYRRACWRIIQRSVCAYNPNEARRLLAKPDSPKARACRPSCSATTLKRIISWSPKRFRRCGKRHLNVVVKIENQEWKVYLKKLQTDPFVVHRAGWGADYPDPDNFMKLFTANSGNNHGRWKNPKFDNCSIKPPANPKREAHPTVRRSAKNS